MATTKIDDIDLYVGLTAEAQECWNFKKFLLDNNIKFRVLNYNDDSQHQTLFQGLSTWWDDVTFDKFPLLTYVEIDPDLPPSQYVRKYATKPSDLQTGNFLQLAAKNV